MPVSFHAQRRLDGEEQGANDDRAVAERERGGKRKARDKTGCMNGEHAREREREGAHWEEQRVEGERGDEKQGRAG